MPRDPPRTFLVSQPALNLFCRKKMRLKRSNNYGLPLLKFLATPLPRAYLSYIICSSRCRKKATGKGSPRRGTVPCKGGGSRGAGRALAPHFFFQGGLGGLIYAFISTVIQVGLPLRECIWNLIGLPLKLKPRKELQSRDVFFKILFVEWGEQKSVR